MEKSTKKRLFIGLLSVSVLFLAILAVLLLFFLFNFNKPPVQGILITIGFMVASLVLCMGLGILAIVISILSDKPMGRFSQILLKRALSLYPIVLSIGKLFMIKTDSIQGSFVAVNNQLVHSGHFSLPGDKIIVLAPHCLQNSECGAKVTLDSANCYKCGKCDVAGLVEICEKYAVHLVVVTGGTLARNFVKEIRPKAVVAVACERDLSSGIMDVLPLPAIGVGNTRPEGPCRNTRVLLSEVEEAILFFLAENMSDSTQERVMVQT